VATRGSRCKKFKLRNGGGKENRTCLIELGEITKTQKTSRSNSHQILVRVVYGSKSVHKTEKQDKGAKRKGAVRWQDRQLGILRWGKRRSDKQKQERRSRSIW